MASDDRITIEEREAECVKWYKYYVDHVKKHEMQGYVSRRYYYDMVSNKVGISWEWVKKILLRAAKRKTRKSRNRK